MSDEWTDRLEDCVKCPHCGYEFQIDEPYEYGNDEHTEEYCPECDQPFKMSTQIVTEYYFKARKLKEDEQN